MQLRIVIIEDEPVTSRLLQSTLTQLQVGNCVATLGTVEQSVKWFRQHTADYDIVLMDIRLADGLSLDIFSQVEIIVPVIFITAYEDYMLPAFKTTGIDYILKPFETSDIQKALDKFHLLTDGAHRTDNAGIRQLLEQATQSFKLYRQYFLVHFRNKLLPIPTSEIAWFYTVNEVSHAVTYDNKKYIVDHTMEELEKQLDPTIFFRANRQFITQKKAIQEVEFFFNSRLLLRLNPATEENVIISKARVPIFKQWMNA